MQHLEMGKWLQLKKAGKNVGKIGAHLSDLWEWSLGYRMPHNSSKFGTSHDLHLAYARTAMIEENKLQLTESLGRSRLLALKLIWPMKAIPQSLRRKKFSTTIGINYGRMERGGSTH